ncbi:hypothetical protein DICVIV_08362 [Dictyocaulus viviparus]|uniref:Uncharacterized protein n=1 Tax=Dictyocaulus viviparus TaxID=29172 RepID=A0A0D8XPB3_DICVI|nr:hypothetical protein DICVIV_08362 [Dictyocaulus viviparus]
MCEIFSIRIRANLLRPHVDNSFHWIIIFIHKLLCTRFSYGSIKLLMNINKHIQPFSIRLYNIHLVIKKMIFFVLMALIASVLAEGYGVPSSSAQNSVAPAPVPYGAPYSTNPVVVPQQTQQPIQYQPFTAFNQPIPIGMQHIGLNGYPTSIGYGVYSAQPQQLTQSPYQMYAQQPLSNSLYMNYPQGLGMQPQHQPQQQPQQQTSMTSLPSTETAYLPSSYIQSSYIPSASSSSSSSNGYASQHTISGGGMAREAATLTASTLTAFTSLTPSTSDPWASLSGAGATPAKKEENRMKKNSDGA